MKVGATEDYSNLGVPTLTLALSLRERGIRDSVSDGHNFVNQQLGIDGSVSILLFYNAISLWCGGMCQRCVKRCHTVGDAHPTLNPMTIYASTTFQNDRGWWHISCFFIFVHDISLQDVQ